jgi:hypothetical protein
LRELSPSRPSLIGGIHPTVLGRRAIAQQPSNQLAVFCKQLFDRRRDVFGFDLRKMREAGKI